MLGLTLRVSCAAHKPACTHAMRPVVVPSLQRTVSLPLSTCANHHPTTLGPTHPPQVGRAKEKAADAEKKKKRAVDKFVTFVRTAEGLYSTTTWDEFEGAFKDEEEFVAVRHSHPAGECGDTRLTTHACMPSLLPGAVGFSMIMARKTLHESCYGGASRV